MPQLGSRPHPGDITYAPVERQPIGGGIHMLWDMFYRIEALNDILDTDDVASMELRYERLQSKIRSKFHEGWILVEHRDMGRVRLTEDNEPTRVCYRDALTFHKVVLRA